jgi:hypothetical protein
LHRYRVLAGVRRRTGAISLGQGSLSGSHRLTRVRVTELTRSARLCICQCGPRRNDRCGLGGLSALGQTAARRSGCPVVDAEQSVAATVEQHAAPGSDQAEICRWPEAARTSSGHFSSQRRRFAPCPAHPKPRLATAGHESSLTAAPVQSLSRGRRAGTGPGRRCRGRCSFLSAVRRPR